MDENRPQTHGPQHHSYRLKPAILVLIGLVGGVALYFAVMAWYFTGVDPGGGPSGPEGRDETMSPSTDRGKGNFALEKTVLKTPEASAIPAQQATPPTAEKEISFELGGGVRLELVLIPAGEFKMGSPNSDNNAEQGEKPQHQVRITKPFYLGRYLVRQEQWEAVMGDNPSYLKEAKNPVESASWEDCQKFLGKLNEKFGRSGDISSCRPKRSGNMPAGPGARRTSASATISRGWTNLRGMTRTRTKSRIPWREKAEFLGAIRHAWERLGVVRRLVR